MRSKALHYLPPFVSKDFRYLAGVIKLFNIPLLSVVVIDAPGVSGACFSMVVVEGVQRCRFGGGRGAATVPAVVGEDKELCGGEGEDFPFRGCTGVVVLLTPPSYLSVQAPLAANVGGYVGVCGRDDVFS